MLHPRGLAEAEVVDAPGVVVLGSPVLHLFILALGLAREGPPQSPEFCHCSKGCLLYIMI